MPLSMSVVSLDTSLALLMTRWVCSTQLSVDSRNRMRPTNITALSAPMPRGMPMLRLSILLKLSWSMEACPFMFSPRI